LSILMLYPTQPDDVPYFSLINFLIAKLSCFEMRLKCARIEF